MHRPTTKGHFTHETESPWLLHLKHSHWWKRRSRSHLLHATLEGPTEYVNARWDVSLCGFLHSIEWIMVSWSLGLFLKSHLLGGRPNTKPGGHGNPNAHNWYFPIFIMCKDPAWINFFIKITFGWVPGHIWLHTTLEGPWPHYMIWEVCWDGLWTLSFWALTISWSWLLARVWSGPKYCYEPNRPS